MRELDASARFVVQYSGNIGRFHEIETILKAADRLADEPFLFLFIGSGRQAALVRNRSEDVESGNVRLFPYQPRERLGETLTACDVGLVTLLEGLAGLCVPSKLYGVLAAGKPVVVIGPLGCEAAQVVREGRCGAVVTPGDVDSLVRTLRALRESPELRKRLGKAARAVFEGSYDLPNIARQWEGMFAAIFNPRR